MQTPHCHCPVFADDHLIPRIRECLDGAPVPQRSDSPTGRELLKLYATDYFTKMSEVSTKGLMQAFLMLLLQKASYGGIKKQGAAFLDASLWVMCRFRKLAWSPRNAHFGWMKKLSIFFQDQRYRLFLASACP